MKLNQILREAQGDIVIVHRSKDARKNGTTEAGELETDYSHIDPLNGDFNASDVGLRSLKGCPAGTIKGKFSVNRNELSSLEFGPKIVNFAYDCRDNQLTSLEHGPMSCEALYCDRNPALTSLHGIGQRYLKQCKRFIIGENEIKEAALGIILVKDLSFFSFDGVFGTPKSKALRIIDDHLRKDRDIMECKEELMEAGLKEYAKL